MSHAPIVLTRLAVRARGATAPPDEAWVRDRVALLRRLAWPALRRAGTGLAWVLVVDADRRELVADLTGDLDLPGGSVHLAVGEGFSPTTSDLELDSTVHAGADAFVTIRLDSDDALLPGSVDAVLRAADGADDGTLIDLAHGYQLDLDRGELIEVVYRPWRQGPFLALVHRGRSAMLDTGGPHTSARDGRALRRVGVPAWLQGIHGANVSNDRRARSPRVRAARAVRRLPRGDAAAVWRDGRVVGATDAASILAAAGLADLIRR